MENFKRRVFRRFFPTLWPVQLLKAFQSRRTWNLRMKMQIPTLQISRGRWEVYMPEWKSTLNREIRSWLLFFFFFGRTPERKSRRRKMKKSLTGTGSWRGGMGRGGGVKERRGVNESYVKMKKMSERELSSINLAQLYCFWNERDSLLLSTLQE